VKSVEEQLKLIRRGVDQLVPETELRQKLDRSVRENRPLRIKYGIDPTGIDVHLGHTVPLRKLRLFQELGHQAVLIIGTYTALVGDPSGRDQSRTRLTPEQVDANARDYLKQVSKVIDISKTEVRYNGEWFSKFRFLDVLTLTTHITMQRMLERDDFTKRLKAGTPIYLHECLYPLMQGHDSVEVKADVELGGSEQLFSFMVARDLQRDAGQEAQVCVTLPILRGLDGQRRMGKSLNNYIGVGEPAYEMFAKAMKIPDELMTEWFELLTDLPVEVIRGLTDPGQTHPMTAKKNLGKEIAAFYHGRENAELAALQWESVVSQGHDPEEIREVTLARDELDPAGNMWVCKLLVRLALVQNNTEARRFLGPNSAVTVGPDRQKITDQKAAVPVTDGLVVRVGNRRVARVRLA
jgi:tyrosyl-tRNA synthetase